MARTAIQEVSSVHCYSRVKVGPVVLRGVEKRQFRGVISTVVLLQTKAMEEPFGATETNCQMVVENVCDHLHNFHPFPGEMSPILERLSPLISAIQPRKSRKSPPDYTINQKRRWEGGVGRP